MRTQIQICLHNKKSRKSFDIFLKRNASDKLTSLEKHFFSPKDEEYDYCNGRYYYERNIIEGIYLYSYNML